MKQFHVEEIWCPDRAQEAEDAAAPTAVRTYNKSFAEAVAICPLIGDRLAPYDFAKCDVQQIALGIEEEERRLMNAERKEYADWSSWRASFRWVPLSFRRNGLIPTFHSPPALGQEATRCAFRC